MSDSPQFVFTTCQVGAESPLKQEIDRTQPNWRFAFSRPGFATFKAPVEQSLPADFVLPSIFARASGMSLGKVSGPDVRAMASAAWELAADLPTIDRLHIWHREGLAPTGAKNSVTLIDSFFEAMAHDVPIPKNVRPDVRDKKKTKARSGMTVLDCVLVEPDQWWVGHHQASSVASCLPGGMFEIGPPEHAVSRAYFKMEEALLWSRVPLRAGMPCIELGCAPGGSSQALLNRGLEVFGIDPAEVDPRVLSHPRFHHIRKRGKDVRRNEFRAIGLLAADMSVVPQYTLDTVESIVTHPGINIPGLIMMLKLTDWKLAAEIPKYLSRIRSWGYRYVQARQLQHNGQEICVSALKNRSLRRLWAGKRTAKKPQANKKETVDQAVLDANAVDSRYET